MKLNYGPGLQQLGQTIGGIAQLSSDQAQRKFQVSQIADENLYGANARSAQIKVQDYMRELLQDASTKFYSEGFDLDAAGDELSSKVYEFYEQNASQWLKSDRYKDRFTSEVLDQLVADMRTGVDETAFQVKNQLAAESASNTIDEALSMLGKGADANGVYEIMMDSLATIHSAQPMARTQYEKKLGELNGAFNDAYTRTQIAKAVNSGLFTGEDILKIVDAVQDPSTIDKETGWGAAAASIAGTLKRKDDPTNPGTQLKPFTDAESEVMRDYAKSLLGVRESELSSVISEHQDTMVQHFDKMKEENPDSFTLAAVEDYIKTDRVLAQNKDGAAYTAIKNMRDQAKANQDFLSIRRMQFTIADQDQSAMLAPATDAAAKVSVNGTEYGLWSEMEGTLREDFRKQARPKFFSESSYQQAEDLYVSSVAVQYNQKIMEGLFAEYDAQVMGVKPSVEASITETPTKSVVNEDGTVSTVSTISIGEDGLEVLIPTIVDGKKLSDNEAIATYRKTGQHYGKYSSVEEANRAAVALHQSEARRISGATIREQVDMDSRFDLLGAESAKIAREAVYDQFTRNGLTVEARQAATYATLRSTAMNQYMSAEKRKAEIGRNRANLSDKQFSDLEKLVGDTQTFSAYEMYTKQIDLFADELVRSMFEVKEDAKFNFQQQQKYDTIRGQLQKAFDDTMLEHPEDMTDELAKQWMTSNLDIGNASLMRFLQYGIGDEAEWKGKTGEDALALFQTGRVDKDLMPEAYSMLAFYTDSLTKGLGIEPSETAMIATNRGIVYSVKADRIPALAEAYGNEASDVDVTLRWTIDEKGNPSALYGVPLADEDGSPMTDEQGLQVWQYFYLQEEEPADSPVVPLGAVKHGTATPENLLLLVSQAIKDGRTLTVAEISRIPGMEHVTQEEIDVMFKAIQRTPMEEKRKESYASARSLPAGTVPNEYGKIQQDAVLGPAKQNVPDYETVIAEMRENPDTKAYAQQLYTRVKTMAQFEESKLSSVNIQDPTWQYFTKQGISKTQIEAMIKKVLTEKGK